MKLSKHLRAAASIVANNPRYNAMCQAIREVRPRGTVDSTKAEGFVSSLYEEDASKYHGDAPSTSYWFGPTTLSGYRKGTLAERNEYRRMRVLALLFAACVAEDEE